jgi:hypothetical protein
MTSRIFNKETGRINDVEISSSPDTIALLVASIRQICLAFKKIELPCTPERERAALENFIAIEQSFEMFTLPREDYERFSLVSSMLWDGVMRNIRLDTLVPRHGPGATAERISGNQKFAWQFWNERLELYFPLIDNGFPVSIGEFCRQEAELEKVSFIPWELETPVRVTPVPKTLKGPRIIAIEPCCMQYAQQGIRRALYASIESHWLAAGHINFRDQSINQSYAMSSSLDGRLATIDLKDASDRVPRDLALLMFRGNPELMGFIDACRSTHAEMPDGTIIGPLNKFASMGSALCFPVEAMYFYTICIVASLAKHDLPVSYSNLRKVAASVYVYGDDLLVPVDVATTVSDYLRKYNCMVNERKSFWTGKFRESCGVDAYLGFSVTPIYVGTTLPRHRRHGSEFLSWVATANLLFKKKYIRTSLFIFDKIESIFGELPSVHEESPVPGRNHFWSRPNLPKRRNVDTQQIEIKCWVPSPVYRTDILEGYAALQKSLYKLLGKSEEPYKVRSSHPLDVFLRQVEKEASLDEKHLERTAQHGAVALKRRWVPNYQFGI